MGVHRNKTNLRIINCSSPLIKKPYTFHFFQLRIKKLIETIFRPQHQNTSKDFNQIGEKFGEKNWSEFRFCFGL